jgi:hypothetical protein
MPLPLDLSLLFFGATTLGLVAAMFVGQAIGGALGTLLGPRRGGPGHDPH